MCDASHVPPFRSSCDRDLPEPGKTAPMRPRDFERSCPKPSLLVLAPSVGYRRPPDVSPSKETLACTSFPLCSPLNLNTFPLSHGRMNFTLECSARITCTMNSSKLLVGVVRKPFETLSLVGPASMHSLLVLGKGRLHTMSWSPTDDDPEKKNLDRPALMINIPCPR
jgi:hypothetical protein